MKVKYTGKECVSLTIGKEYNVISIENKWYRIKDDTDDDYLFPPSVFQITDKNNMPKEITIK